MLWSASCRPGDAEYAGTVPALRLGTLFKQLASEGKFSHTFGCLDPVQVVQMANYLSTIYVSGWQSSSTASTTNEPGPDLSVTLQKRRRLAATGRSCLAINSLLLSNGFSFHFSVSLDQG